MDLMQGFSTEMAEEMGGDGTALGEGSTVCIKGHLVPTSPHTRSLDFSALASEGAILQQVTAVRFSYCSKGPAGKWACKHLGQRSQPVTFLEWLWSLLEGAVAPSTIHHLTSRRKLRKMSAWSLCQKQSATDNHVPNKNIQNPRIGQLMMPNYNSTVIDWCLSLIAIHLLSSVLCPPHPCFNCPLWAFPYWWRHLLLRWVKCLPTLCSTVAVLQSPIDLGV